MNILKWNDKLKLCNLHNKEVRPGMIQFIELINKYGTIKTFDINEILKF